MFGKTARRWGMLMLICALLLTGCGGNSVPRLSGGPEASDEVTSQNGPVVKKGNYLYFVNGAADSTLSPEYGKTDEDQRGYIYRAALDEQGNVKENGIDLLCPKSVTLLSANGGLFLAGDRLYFFASTTHKDKYGDILSSYIDLYTVRLDGTDCRELTYLTLTPSTYRWYLIDGRAYFTYVNTTDAAVVTVDDAGKSTAVLEDYTGTPILGDDGYAYYLTPIVKDGQEDLPEDEREEESYHEVCRTHVVSGSEEKIFAKDNADLYVMVNKLNVTLTGVEAGVLYYTYSQPSTVTVVMAYDLAKKVSARISDNALTTVHRYLGFDENGKYRGVIATYSSKLMFVQPGEGTHASTTNLLEGFSSLPSTILKLDGDYLYYSDGSALYRVRIRDENGWTVHAEGEKIFGAAINSSVPFEVLDGYVYFAASSTAHPTYASYLYRLPADTVIPDDADEEEIPDPELIGKLNATDREIYDETQADLDKEAEKNQNA